MTVKPSKLIPLYRKELPLYGTIGAQLRQIDNILLANMHQRIGATPFSSEHMRWGRIIETRADIKQNGIANTRSTGNYTGLQLGSDIWNNSSWRIGGYLGYLHGDIKVDGFASGIHGYVGKNSLRTYVLGAYGNYANDKGAYLDIVLQGARHHVGIKPDGNPNSIEKGHGMTASVEVGKPFVLGNSVWTIEPQAQIIHQWLELNDSYISGYTTVRQNHNSAWLFRAGARMEGRYQTSKGILRPYARVNIFYSPNDADRTTFITSVASFSFKAGTAHTSTELAIGGSYELTDKVKLYGEISHIWSNGGDARVKAPINGSVGLKINW